MAQASNKKIEKDDISPLSLHLKRAWQEGALFVLGFTAIYFIIALFSYHPTDPSWSQTGDKVLNIVGPSGAWLADIFLTIFGYLAYIFPFMLAYVGWLIFKGSRSEHAFDIRNIVLRGIGFIVLILAGCGLSYLHFLVPIVALPEGAGGILGDIVGSFMQQRFFFLGSTLLLLALFLTGITMFTSLSWFKLMDATGGLVLKTISMIRNFIFESYNRWQDRRAQKNHEKHFRENTEKAIEITYSRPPPKIEPIIQAVQKGKRSEVERQLPMFKSESDGKLPALSLLDVAEPNPHRLSKDALEAISRQVEIKIQEFNITAKVVAVHPGPVITRFELLPAAGVKVSQFTNLAKDIARSLSVISVRIVEVIPGKSTIGLEIPNEIREIVRLSETLESKAFESATSPLTLVLGKDISGIPIVADLAKMPHLLVAGTTGAGKSVALNAMLLSMLYNATPDEVRLILIDPKMLELSIYDGIPHLLSPVVTDMKEASNALRWCVKEMDRRYKLMAALKVRNLSGYNRKILEAEKAGEPIMDPTHPANHPEPAEQLTTFPFIVIIIDELADMMMVVGKKIDELIARLAQKARASGIHLILATQRPSVDVLTGLIKANIPTRISFQVSSRVDSRTILDQMGAEQLLGHGDMLYLPPGTAVPQRIHGAFVDDHEVHNVVEDLKQRGKPAYIDAVLAEPIDTEAGVYPGDDDSEMDEYYDQAVRIVTETRRASISGVQRRLKVGYNRAARMVEAMERAGVVGPLESNGAREVLAPPPPKD
ncbi:MAG: DNA translocase FtsK [Gammaproteobacteria bacterium]